MKLQCPFEPELLDAIAAGWPARADAALIEHVHACSLCTDTVDVAAAFFEDREIARTEAPVPAASAVWWRAQIRVREEAARLAARPIALVQMIATACVAAASLAVAPSATAWLRQIIATLGVADWLSTAGDVSLSWVVGAAAYTTLPLLAVGIWIVLAPVFVYLALDE